MSDTFFYGTLDDFVDDQAFFALAGLALPPLSPSPPPSSDLASTRPLGFEAPSRRGHGIFDGRVDGGAQSGSGLGRPRSGAAIVPGPTRPGPSDRPTRSGLSRLNPHASTPPSRLQIPNPPPFQADSLSLGATSVTPNRSPPSSDFPFRGHPTLSIRAAPRQRRRHRTLQSECDFRDLPCVATQPRSLHRNSNTASASISLGHSAVHRTFADDLGDGNSSASPASPRQLSPLMSGNPRAKRNLRPGDLSMPAVPSQQAGPSAGSAPRPTRRRSTPRTSQPEPDSSLQKRKREASTADDLFSDDVWGDPEVVDLVDKDEVPPEILSNSQEEATKNYVKLSAFDCAICMDNVTDLTVTHCGHLFCSECLHAALNMNPAKRVCPICRQKIDPVPASGKFSQRAKGFYPLELKLMTKKTLGKKPERQAT